MAYADMTEHLAEKQSTCKKNDIACDEISFIVNKKDE
jgi:hypothetical protein